MANLSFLEASGLSRSAKAARTLAKRSLCPSGEATPSM